jgi:hypothetical protein
MIISASRRTDIPAFFCDWFFNRISEGFVMVRNPMNIHQISRINITQEVVDCIVFWTKNPIHMFNKLHLLKRYNYYFQFTITPYSQNLEPNVPSQNEAILHFQALSKLIGKERVIWRYDPIILTQEMDFAFHKKQFENMAAKFAGYTKRCVISFLDLYKKSIKNLHGIKLLSITEVDMKQLAELLLSIAKRYNIQIVSCAEEIDLSQIGIPHGKCIDDKLISEISGRNIDVLKDKSQRQVCGCVASIDIGAYNTCGHGCLYCYANYDNNRVKNNLSLHSSKSPLLFGNIGPNDRIVDRKVFSCFKAQTDFFLQKG